MTLGQPNFVAYFIPEGDVPGWETTESDGLIEIQRGDYNGTTPYAGNQWAELNALEASELYQVIDTSTLQGQTLTWSFAHHGFQGIGSVPGTTDTIQLRIGPDGAVPNFTYNATTGPTTWAVYSGTYTVPVGQTTTRFGWQSLTGQGNGNYLDAVSFGTPGCSTDLGVDKTSPDTVFAPGAPITYQINITNTGTVVGQFDVSGATLTDAVPADIENVTWTCAASLGSTCGNASGSGNAINETYDILESGIVTYTVTGTVAAGSTLTELTNTAAVAVPATSDGQPITDIDPSNNTSTVTTPLAQPGIEVDKIADYTGPLTVGDVIPYRFVVTNTGDVALENVVVTDPLPGLSAITPASVATLAPGANTTFNATYTVTQTDVDAGTLSNTASVTTDPIGAIPPPTDEDSEIVPGEPDPQIGIVKTNDGASATVGDTITYSFEVTNTGNITLNNVIVDDPLPGLSAVSPASYPSLAPGASTMFTATYVVTQTDVDRGSIFNAATAFGETPTECTSCLPGVLETDDNLLFLAQRPGLDIVKSSDPAGGVEEGDIVTYTFEATNTGNVTLTDVTITDVLPGLTWVTGPNVGDLAPGESATGTATYVVTQADIDAGAIRNTASVTGTPPDGCTCTPPTGTSEHDVPTAGTPGLDLVKASNVPVGSTVGVGDTVTYTFTLTNTGNVPITNATITDALPGLSWVIGPNLGTILSGASATGTATYTVTQADVDSGSIVNAATADGDCGQGCDVPQTGDSETVVTDPAAPSLDLSKSSDQTGTVALGDAITYTFTATNTGNVTLNNVTVTDPLPGLSAIAPASIAELAPGESADFTATYTVSASDVARGFVHNEATASGDPGASCVQCPPVTGGDETDVPTTGNPGVLVDKDADVSGNVTLGQTITYTFDVYNTGDVDLENIVVTDALPGLSAIDCPQTTVGVGQSVQCTAAYTVTQADMDNGRIDNTATVSADPVNGDPTVTDGDDKNIPTAPQVPGIDIVKSADTAGPVAVGDVITYTFDVTNTGNVTLTDVTISDSLAGLSWVTGPNVGDLAPGESATGTATYTVTQADVDAGSVYNAATVTGTPPDACVDCLPPTGGDDNDVPTEDPAPAVDFTKEADTQGPVNLGDTITYTFTATNTGNITLANVTIADALPGLTWVTGPDLGALTPGESATGTATYVVTEVDIITGSVLNTATVDIEFPPSCTACPPIDPPAPEVEIPTEDPVPALDIDKTADTAGPVAVGDTITYSFVVTNTGNVTISGVTLSDALPGLTWVTGPDLGDLAPDESATGTATYVVTEADVIAGGVANAASVTGEPPADCTTCPEIDPPTDGVDVPTDEPVSALSIEKEADTAGPVAAGDVITYTFTVVNTGNVTLDDVTISDVLVGLTWVTGPNVGTLAPGESATGTATYTVTEADVIAGLVSNTATATGAPPVDCTTCPEVVPPTDEVEVPTDVPAPALSIDKEADTAGPVAAGDVITYTFTVVNTGNVTISNVTISDALPGLTWVTGPALGDPAPGESATGTATYTVTDADVIAGGVANSATATGETPVDCTTCPAIDPPVDEVDVPTNELSPSLSIDKTADTAGPVAVGDTITYTFTVTNTGNVLITNVSVADALPGLAWVTGPALGDLAPGTSATGTATYVVTQADIDAGSIANSATATGDPDPNCVDCPPVDPPTDEIEIPTDNGSGLTLEKSSDTEGPVDVGDIITYTFTVTNTGSVTLTDIAIDDPKIGTVTCANTLAPGETITCSAPYTVTEADVEAGQVYNSATVSGTTPGGETSTDGDDDTVPTIDPCAPVETPLSGDAFNLSLRALQVDPSTPIAEPTDEPTLEPTETVTETATATETATVDPGTPEPTETATEEPADPGTPAVDETPTPDGTPQVSPTCPTPQPTPTPKPQTPGGGGGTGGGGGGSIPPVTTLPGTGANATSTDSDNALYLILLIATVSALGALSIALNRAKRGVTRR